MSKDSQQLPIFSFYILSVRSMSLSSSFKLSSSINAVHGLQEGSALEFLILESFLSKFNVTRQHIESMLNKITFKILKQVSASFINSRQSMGNSCQFLQRNIFIELLIEELSFNDGPEFVIMASHPAQALNNRSEGFAVVFVHISYHLVNDGHQLFVEVLGKRDVMLPKMVKGLGKVVVVDFISIV